MLQLTPTEHSFSIHSFTGTRLEPIWNLVQTISKKEIKRRSQKDPIDKLGEGDSAGEIESHPMAQYKLVLLGETAVGKSSVALRFARDQFLEYQESTIGAAFLTNVSCSWLVLSPDVGGCLGQGTFSEEISGRDMQPSCGWLEFGLASG